MCKISIVIPVYNVSLYIERCLLSVIKQTYSNLETILVDDASPDNSIEKAKEILSLYPDKNIQIVTHLCNKGLSAARNTGVRAATGDYVYFLDSDDAISENAMTLLAEAAIKANADFVIGDIQVVNASGKQYPSLLLKDGDILCGKDIIDSFLQKKWYEMACNKLVRKSLFLQQGCWFYEGIVHEDNLWSFYLAGYSTRMVVCKYPTYFYYINSQSITQKKTIRNFDSLYIVLSEILKESAHIDNKQTRFFLCQYLWSMRIFFVKSLLRSDLDKIYIQQMYSRIIDLYNLSWLNSCTKSITVLMKDLLLDFIYKIKYQ